MDNSEVKETKVVNETEQTTQKEETTSVATTQTTTPTTTVVPTKKENEEVIELENLNLDFACDLMSVPTVSSEEYRMVTYIVLWARRNNVKYEFDTYGNLYVTKGKVKDGEFYPCVTSHLDTVQQKQKSYAQAGCSLDLKIRKSLKKHELYVDGMGIGADCKTGILISLPLFEHFDTIKAAFFLEEEIGMKGSAHMNTEWFNDVGYVIGWDSPELNRAAWSCSGTKLMSKEFFENNIKEICAKHGLTKFHAEPFTDVKHIREKTNIICMNFGNGGYSAHMPTEYMVLEDTDKALTMGIDLIKNLGKKQFLLEHKEHSYQWVKGEDGVYHKPEDDVDEVYFRKLDGYGSYYGGNSSYYDDMDDYYAARYGTRHTSGGTVTHTSTTSNQQPSTTTPTTTKKEETVSIETVKYITERYEERISDIKTALTNRCSELGIDFEQFKEIFEQKVKF